MVPPVAMPIVAVLLRGLMGWLGLDVGIVVLVLVGAGEMVKINDDALEAEGELVWCKWDGVDEFVCEVEAEAVVGAGVEVEVDDTGVDLLASVVLTMSLLSGRPKLTVKVVNGYTIVVEVFMVVEVCIVVKVCISVTKTVWICDVPNADDGGGGGDDDAEVDEQAESMSGNAGSREAVYTCTAEGPPQKVDSSPLHGVWQSLSWVSMRLAQLSILLPR